MAAALAKAQVKFLDAGERVVVLDNLSIRRRLAIGEDAPFIVGDTGDQPLVSRLIGERDIDAIIHFAASPPDSVCGPLSYRNNTVNSRAPIEWRSKVA